MRVLYVDLEREWRGGQSQALLTLGGLRERGHEIELLAARDSATCESCLGGWDHGSSSTAIGLARLGCSRRARFDCPEAI